MDKQAGFVQACLLAPDIFRPLIKESTPMDISFECGTCGKHLVVDEAGAGMSIDCPGCGKPVYVPNSTSQNQADPPTRVEVKSAAPVSSPKVSSSSGERQAGWSPPVLVTKYRALRTVANVYEFMAVPAAIVQVLLAFLAYKAVAPLYGDVAIIPAIVIGVVGVFSMVMMYAMAESIRVFIDIEENTRATRQLIEHELHIKYYTPAPPREPPRVSSTSSSSPPQPSHVRFSNR